MAVVRIATPLGQGQGRRESWGAISTARNGRERSYAEWREFNSSQMTLEEERRRFLSVMGKTLDEWAQVELICVRYSLSAWALRRTTPGRHFTL